MNSSIQTLPGTPKPLGLSFHEDIANFAVYSSQANNVSLCLFLNHSDEPEQMIPLNASEEHIWHIGIKNLPKSFLYAYQVKNTEKTYILSDPYAKRLSDDVSWGDFSKKRLPLLCSCEQIEPFDWQGTSFPNLPSEELIIYEMHIRGFTNHPSSQVKKPGTYLGLIEKIPYLKKLGINAVELMPVFLFDETHTFHFDPATKQPLVNYWGYSPISFFQPMSRYASDPKNVLSEFKTMVRELHRAGIEVILDVVYNHTPESENYIVSYRGLDRAGYYMLSPEGADQNYSGCGNTFQTNQNPAMNLILDSLRYWRTEMHIDGFRFDLASILTRDSNGCPLENPPLLQKISEDPLLQKVKLIAEPWDAAGLYQLGVFPKWGHWAQWNGLFRDHTRRFLKGTSQHAGAFANALLGSDGSSGSTNTPLININFITAHDGFCLYDLVRYQNKQNETNGEENRDGANANDSWNCGEEGPSKNKEIEGLRERQMRNFFLALFLSQGIPMLLMGDELGHTRKGNNNPFPQDNEINWLNWDLFHDKQSQCDFVSYLIRLRKNHPIFRRTTFLKASEIQWHGLKPNQPNWNDDSRFVALSLHDAKESFYIAFNANHQKAFIELPNNANWTILIDTNSPWNQVDLQEKISSNSFEMLPYSSLLCRTESCI